MKIVVSPAKTLDFETELPTKKYTQSVFLDEAEKLNEVLQKKSPKQLGSLMNISEKLSELNWQRNQDWNLPFSLKNARQAIFAFKGDVYQGIDAYTIPVKKLDQLQNQLRILSGQYGLLKPLDLMQPYRLEMGTKLKVNKAKDLYEFWGNKITKSLNKELEKDEVLINLASNEYFKAIDKKTLNAPIITPVFKDYKNGKLKIISFYAKKARGLMVRYIIDNNIKKPEDIKGFDYDGYAFDANLSTDKNWMFTR
ncbi:MAG TPA: peroxide stress protein YaaA [Flavobacteriaceae bacterium]|nr:peroxide stress protein YaaA [Flavobacteriaceae bacterium]